MGILDQVGGALSGLAGGAKGAGTNAILIQQVIAYLSKPGALGNLTAAFQQHGLGHLLQSWLSSGQNLPISAAQLQQVLGTGTLTEMAQKAGIAMPEAASMLSGLLPQVIDKVSPGGAAPSANDLGGLLSSVGKMFG